MLLASSQPPCKAGSTQQPGDRLINPSKPPSCRISHLGPTPAKNGAALQEPQTAQYQIRGCHHRCRTHHLRTYTSTICRRIHSEVLGYRPGAPQMLRAQAGLGVHGGSREIHLKEGVRGHFHPILDLHTAG
ncbi:hypothetical protein CB1_000307014 [Camelus ferus]|nr:hypothetical protein CB1_000307014 [Camelus ferus]